MDVHLQCLLKSASGHLVVLLVVTVTGCNSLSTGMVEEDRPFPPQVEFSDAGLRDEITIGRMTVARDESDLLDMDVPLRSTTHLPIMADYRVTFFDRNGVPVDSPTPWTALVLPPNGFANLKITSPSTRAVDFRIELRYAR